MKEEKEERDLICPKCETAFEDTGKDYPNGILCPVCPGGLVGVIHPVPKVRWLPRECSNCQELEKELLREKIISSNNRYYERLGRIHAMFVDIEFPLPLNTIRAYLFVGKEVSNPNAQAEISYFKKDVLKKRLHYTVLPETDLEELEATIRADLIEFMMEPADGTD